MSKDGKKEVHGLNYVTANRFYVEIEKEGSISACFTECAGLKAKVKYDTYMEGGVNHQQRIILGQTEFSEVTLKRGITNDLTFLGWASRVLSDLEPINGSVDRSRRNVNILVFNQAGETIQCWTLIGAVPVGWQAPSLQANATNVAIEELTLAYEGLKVAVNLNPASDSSRLGGARILSDGRQLSAGGFFI
ncbi:MAG TPA: phage tail protein [Coleofasciculaceae cyanobacterium]